jgi:glycopeptide antibiotics resistance protein
LHLFTESFASVPLFLPGAALWLVVALLLMPPAARFLDAHRLVTFALTMSLGFVVLATLTPTAVALVGGGSGAATCDFSRLGLPPRSELLSAHDTLRNVLLFVPLGFALGFLPKSPRAAGLIIAAYLSPLLIETVQLVTPVMGRGCQSADVIDNAIGLTVGLALGLGAARLRRMWPGRRPRRQGPGGPW